MSSAAVHGMIEEQFPERIDRQIDGYWVEPWEHPPSVPPPYRPTGAVVPRLGTQDPKDFVCLDLVSRGYVWYPLSEAGVLTYAHSSGLLADEKWTLVVFERGAPVVYRASREDAIEPSEVAALYGADAEKRCRPDRRTVQIRLRRD